ncbi:MAG: DUF1501 domain-containing protein [Gemmataceae bacterium]|nr:DUF1501 domain-containing protein [Gemmataceae bacterium]MCI0739302.1 DUF1501 domain-containing protein [Gemmataceae bacterium]
MLRVLGSPKKLCDGLTRRDMLWAGGLGFLGLGLDGFFRLQETQAASPERRPLHAHFGQAKSCILLFLYGSPSQLEWCDMKPDAPVEIRGELGGIRSTLPGCDVCELFPHMARVMDKVTVVRSMTHEHPIHGVAFATTGVPTIDIPMELNPRDPRHWPFVGSVVDYVERNNPRNRGRRREIPDNIALPFHFSSQRVGEVPRAGPYAAFLGNAYDPLWTEFRGTANRSITKTLQDQTITVQEPYVGITHDSRFELATTTQLSPELTLDRLNTRRSLVEQFDQARAAHARSDAGRHLDRYRDMAYQLIGSTRLQQALDVCREPMSLREAYGMTIFGQAALSARRLVEAGSKFVTVFWDEFGLAGSGWDTHWEHYPRMRNELCPGLDHALYGLIRDLDQRGMLDETLVMVLSEHGRTPRLNNARGGGRDHWSQAYTCLFAGGGVAHGRVVGRTDRHGATVTERPVSPKDILATAYHLLGIDPETHLYDRTRRPFPLVQNGHVVAEMLA